MTIYIWTLLEHNILYIDITGYNFIENEEGDDIWIIDFEHATYVVDASNRHENEFIEKLLKGFDEWNPEL